MTGSNLLSAAIMLGALTFGAALPATAQASAGTRAPAGVEDAADGPATVAAIDPTGTFDFLASFGIEARTGTIEIRADANGILGGEVRLQGESDPAIIDSVTVDGNHVQIAALVQGQLPVTIDLDFKDADSFSGTIAVPNDSIDIDGRRRAP